MATGARHKPLWVTAYLTGEDRNKLIEKVQDIRLMPQGTVKNLRKFQKSS